MGAETAPVPAPAWADEAWADDGDDDAGCAVAAPAGATPLHATILAWTVERLSGRGYPRPLCKRLALLLAGLLAGERATAAGVTAAAHDLAITPAREESIARRVARLLDDPRLDPERLLPDLFADLLPTLLAGWVAAHAANEPSGPAHHRRFRPVRLVVDETSVDGRLHVLAVGLAYQGLAVPLAVRVWAQNTPQPEGAYWAHLLGALGQVQALLPPVLRDHVLLLADRAYGVPRLLDLCAALGWSYVVRVQGQALVRWPDGTEQAVRRLVPRPGAVWLGPAGPAAGTAGPTDAEDQALVLKHAGWRRCRVAAAWAVGQDEPWLLLTDLLAAAARLREYAGRWAIERTFLAWKSHGWDVEGCGLRDPRRLGRLVSGLATATLWRLALALPVALALIAGLAARGARRGARPRQLPLPFAPPAPGPRPWPAKFSLLTWGAKSLRAVDPRTSTPARRWTLPRWDPLQPWSAHCCQAHATAT